MTLIKAMISRGIPAASGTEKVMRLVALLFFLGCFAPSFAAEGAPSKSDAAGTGAKSGAKPAAVSPDTGESLIYGQSFPMTDRARKTIAAAIAQDDRAKILGSFESGAERMTDPKDKKAVLAALASYEERMGLPDRASRHYSAAANADPAARDDSLLLDAARAALSANDAKTADGYVRTVLVTCFDDRLLARSRVYAAWIELASGDAQGALSLIRSLSQGKAFEPYAPSLLFTLWWSEGDSSAKDRLLSAYPHSPEAAVASGSMSLAAVPFWYLMGRNSASVDAFAREGAKNLPKGQNLPDSTTGSGSLRSTGATAEGSPSRENGDPVGMATVDAPAKGAAGTDSGSGEWQQVGFFKNREYADELVARLGKLGFKTAVRADKRPSGTVYFAVLVPEDRDRSAAARLKDAGFESYLVSDDR
jgi:hypothetical protein